MGVIEDLEADLFNDSFYEFFIEAFQNVIDPDVDFIDNWHVKYLCDIGQKIVEAAHSRERHKKDEGDYIINISPRSLKSAIFSVALPAWAWTKYPHLKFVCCSYSNRLSLRLAEDARKLIKSYWYIQRYKDKFEMSKTEDSKEFYRNDKGGFRFSTSEGSSATGEGGDIIIVDDFQNPKMADSKAYRASSNKWNMQTLRNRLNDKTKGYRVYICQRLHDNDHVGNMFKQLGADMLQHICIPAELTDKVKPAELAENYIDGYFFKGRFDDDFLSGEKFDDRYYSSQYLQTPVVEGGNIIKRAWIELIDKPKKYNRCIISADTAFKDKEESDYSVLTIWYETDRFYYLHAMIRKRMQYFELKEMAIELYKHYKPEAFLIEDKASGQSLIQDLVNIGKIPIEPISVDRDKISRLYAVQPLFKNGFVKVCKDASFHYELFDELTTFPKSEHDDIIDSVTQALNYMSGQLNTGPVAKVRRL